MQEQSNSFKQKELIDKFFSDKENIGIIEKDGSVHLNSNEVQLITEMFSFKSAELLKAKLQALPNHSLNEKGIVRKSRNAYALSSNISYIVDQKFMSNMASDTSYTPSLAEQLSLISHVAYDLYKRSLLNKANEASE